LHSHTGPSPQPAQRGKQFDGRDVGHRPRAESVEGDFQKPAILGERRLRATFDAVFFKQFFRDEAECIFPSFGGDLIQLALGRRVDAISQ
jgi:hypothetical protein